MIPPRIEFWIWPILYFDGEGEFGNVWLETGKDGELPPARILIEAIADAIKETNTDED